ncbi:MAG: DNA polymerase [Elusimicrobia bacterium HGW-Elusimicrobia-3]|nr:MAG: DNA polymerase [Elusimicrobia bacterium HGW-Elusimicrobia-3]
MPPTDPSQLVSWLYLDMNSFFASVEQELDPALRGRPVAVVPVRAESTCCIAVSYEGKACGVKTGTLVREARRLCPGIRFIVGDHANYVRCHNSIVEAVESCVPVEAVCSIDEIACRLTGRQRDAGVAAALAQEIKAKIKSSVGSSLKCSIGLGPNRYLAKIAADMNKPDGFTVLRPADLPAALLPLPLRDLPGIGARMEVRLNAKGIFTMERLLSLSARELREAWGSVVGEEMWHLLRGEDIAAKTGEQKSISHSHVLPPELRSGQNALRVLKKLTDKAAARLRQQGFYASGISIYARLTGQDGWKAGCSVMETQDTLVFINAVREMWKEIPRGQVFAVGVALGGLVPEALHAPSLFEDGRGGRLYHTLDQLNARFGKDVLHYGATHESAAVPLRIAFTRIPDPSEL